MRMSPPRGWFHSFERSLVICAVPLSSSGTDCPATEPRSSPSTCIARHRDVALPPYAPELNPVEIFWAYLKRNPLANFAALDAAHLASVATRHVRRLRHCPELLRSFFDATPLFFSRE